MSVRYVRPEVMKLLPIYKMIRSVLAGPAAVKEQGTVFLPMPNAQDTSQANVLRYAAYKTRAVFFEATARTHEGFIGQIFYRDPVIELPPLLKILEESVDGGELTLVQQSKEASSENLGFGRGGLLTDYPTTDGKVTKADQMSGKVRPNIILYKPEQITNWRWSLINGKRLLSMVVLVEGYDIDDDGFEISKGTQYRVMKLMDVEGAIRLVTWIERETKDGLEKLPEVYPTMSTGVPWTVIPFSFFGSKDNNPEPDKPPMEGMAHVNIAHYRNSADYEESLYMVGQPTPWASGLTQEWIDDVWKGTMQLGSRGVIPLPANGSCGLMQADPNTMAKEGMEQKEKQMVALGAKIIENIEVQRTATETSTDAVVENSTLSNVAKNVSAAYMQALKYACWFSGEDESKVVFELNTDFEITKLTPQERNQLLMEWQGGGLTWEEYRWNVKRAGVAFEDDKVAKAKIETDQANAIKLQQEMIGDGQTTEEKTGED